MTTDPPSSGNGLWPEVATAPEPVLTITGHTAVISNVRFLWTRAFCAWCRRGLRLFTDGGTIHTGIKTTDNGPSALHPPCWYTVFRPGHAPVPPPHCPNPACERHEATGPGWLHGRWTLTHEPVQVGDAELLASPAHPHTTALLNEAWATIRVTYPNLARAADAHDRANRDRTHPGQQ